MTRAPRNVAAVPCVRSSRRIPTAVADEKQTARCGPKKRSSKKPVPALPSSRPEPATELASAAHETSADPLHLVPAGLERLAGHFLRDHGRCDRLDGNRLETRLARLDHLRDA